MGEGWGMGIALGDGMEERNTSRRGEVSDSFCVDIQVL